MGRKSNGEEGRLCRGDPGTNPKKKRKLTSIGGKRLWCRPITRTIESLTKEGGWLGPFTPLKKDDLGGTAAGILQGGLGWGQLWGNRGLDEWERGTFRHLGGDSDKEPMLSR